jgi:hypothetical protein
MTESTTHLSIRIIFSNPPIPRQGTDSKYRWDRILLVAGALVLIVALAIKMMMSSLPSAKIVEPVKVSTDGRAVFHPDLPAGVSRTAPLLVTEATIDTPLLVDTSGRQSTVQDSVLSAPVSTAKPQTTQEADSEPVSAARTSVITPGQTRILSEAVQRFVLTNAVNANEPVGGPDGITRDNSSNGVIKLFAYSQVRHLAGEKLVYRWLRGATVAANVEVKVRTDDWRSHTSKYLSKEMRGHWRVEMRTSKGELLAFTEFEY